MRRSYDANTDTPYRLTWVWFNILYKIIHNIQMAYKPSDNIENKPKNRSFAKDNQDYNHLVLNKSK